ncbi:hypothetical protein ANTQUA_LOCUS10368 [Anthophora quadrimaculata]
MDDEVSCKRSIDIAVTNEGRRSHEFSVNRNNLKGVSALGGKCFGQTMTSIQKDLKIDRKVNGWTDLFQVID